MDKQARSAFINSLWNNKKLEKAAHDSVKTRLDKKLNSFDSKMTRHPEALKEQKHYQENWNEYRKRQKKHVMGMLEKVSKKWKASLQTAS